MRESVSFYSELGSWWATFPSLAEDAKPVRELSEIRCLFRPSRKTSESTIMCMPSLRKVWEAQTGGGGGRSIKSRSRRVGSFVFFSFSGSKDPFFITVARCCQALAHCCYLSSFSKVRKFASFPAEPFGL
jgi:hypothetical protein